MIQLEDICKTYHLGEISVPVLKNVSLTVARGELVALMGASGSGKSTLMNILGCLDRPSSGQYRLDGKDVSKLSIAERAMERNRKIGFVFQNFNLIPQLTVLENMEVPLFYQGIPPRVRHKRSETLLERVGLGERMHHRPMELSGGQQQRAAIARALINDPLFILADEPTGNLDTATGHVILDIFDGLHAEGKTILMVTHEPDVAARCERVVTLRDGRILSDEWRDGRHNRKA